MQLRIDIVSDVVCPWCIIGYKQLLQALQQFEGRLEADLHWQPFELNPALPEEGQNIREHMAQKYGASEAQSRGNRAALTELGDALGFSFNYSEDSRIYNTFRAHQLLHWAHEQGQQTELQLVLFTAYFTHGKNVRDIDVLVNAAEQVGLPADEARQVLEEGRFEQEVRQLEQEWQAREIFAVPTFLFNEQYLISGAQQADKFVRVIDKILQQ